MECPIARAEDPGQLLVHDLDHLLAGGQALEHVSANGTLADSRDKVLDDLVVHVSLEKRVANFAHRGIDVSLSYPAVPGQSAEYATQSFRKIIKLGKQEPPTGI